MLQGVFRRMSWPGLRRPVSILFGGGGGVDTREPTRTADPPPTASPCECAPQKLPEVSRPISSRLSTYLYPRRYRELLLELLPKPKKSKKSKLPKESTPKEIERHLFTRFMDEGVNIDNPDHQILQRGVGYLLHSANDAGRVEYLEATLALISRNDVQLKEEHYSIILLSMNRYGWHDAVKRNFKTMAECGIECRLETLFALVTGSLQRRDFKFALEVIEMLVRNAKYRVPPVLFPMEKVVEGCMGAREEEGKRLIEQVLKWHDVVNVTLDRRTVDATVRWIQSLGKRHRISETRILPNGCCEACGENLNAANLSHASHALLLEAIGSLIVQLEERYVDPSKSIFPSLKDFLGEHKFGAVLDGMNVACRVNRTFDYQKLLGMAKEMEKRTGLPSLVVLRQYCKRFLSTESCSDFNQFVEMCKPTKYFFVHDYMDDDIYTMYAALALGPQTFLVSNDQMGDKGEMLHSLALRGLLQEWRRSRQVHVDGGHNISLMMHQRDQPSVQWEMNRQFHLPYTQQDCICIKFDQ